MFSLASFIEMPFGRTKEIRDFCVVLRYLGCPDYAPAEEKLRDEVDYRQQVVEVCSVVQMGAVG